MTDAETLLAELLSGDDARAEAAVPHLAALGPSCLPLLLRLTDSPVADHRWWSIRCLAASAAPEADGALIGALQDPDPSVRQCAALGLRGCPIPEAVPRLKDCLEEADPLLASLAAEALASMGEEALQALTESAQSSHSSARLAAVRALARQRDPLAIPALFAALQDPSALVEHWAAEGLERLGLGMVYFPA